MNPTLSVTGWSIHAFGPFAEHEHAVGPGLTIVHGPNEAGKSSLLRFLLWTMFPTSARQEGAAVAPAGRVPSGEVRVRLGDTPLRATRDLRAGPALLDAAGRAVGGSLATRLDGLDRDTYERIHAFSAAELLDFDALGKDDARERLFAGATAGAGRSVKSAQDQLKKRIDALWKKRGDAELARTRRDLHEAEAELSAARAAAQNFGTFEQQIRALQVEIAATRQREIDARTSVAQHRALLDATPIRRAQREAEAALTILLEQPQLADATALQALRDGHDDLQRRLNTRRADAERSRAKAERRAVDTRVLTIADALEAVHAEADAVQQADDRASALRQTRDGAKGRLQRQLATAGLTHVAGLDLSATSEHRLRAAQARVKVHAEAVTNHERAGAARERCEQQAADARRAADEAPRRPDVLTHAGTVDFLRADAPRRDAARERSRLAALRAAELRESAQHEIVQPEPVAPSSAAQRQEARRRLVAWTPLRAAHDDAVRNHHARRDLAAQRLRDAEAATKLPPPPADDELRAQLAAIEEGENQAFAARERANVHREKAAAHATEVKRQLATLPASWRPAIGRPSADLHVASATAREAARHVASRPTVSAASSARPLPEVDAELARLRAALNTARARDRAAEIPAAMPWAVIALGAVLTILGIVLLVTGSAAIGALVALGGLCVVALGFWWRSRLPASPNLAPLDAAGFARTTSVEELLRAVARLEDERQRADLETRLAGTVAHAAQERERADRANAAWRAAAETIGLPPTTPAEGAEVHLRAIVDAARAQSYADEDAATATAADAAWATWTQRLAALASRYGVAATLADLRALRDARADAVRRRDAADRELKTAREALDQLAAPVAPPALASAEAAAREAVDHAGVPVPMSEALGWLDRADAADRARTDADRADADAGRLQAEVTADDNKLCAVLTALAVERLDDAVSLVATARDLAARADQLAADADAAEKARVLADEALRETAAALRALDGADAAWTAAVGDAGLPASTQADTLDLTLNAARAAQDAAGEIAEADAELPGLAERIGSWRARAAAVLTGADVAPGADLGDERRLVQRLHQRLLAARQASDEAARERAEAEEADRDAEQLAEAARIAYAQLTDALAAHGLPDLDAIGPALQRAAEVTRLQVESAHQGALLRNLLGDRAVDLHAVLDAPDPMGWAAQIAADTHAAEVAAAKADELRRDEGALRQDHTRAQEAADVPQLALRVAGLEAERDRIVRDLARHVLASSLLDQALADFKARHAPGVFRTAADHLARATGGVWTDVRLSDDDKDVLLADASGAWRPSSALSRGTADLLYLCLRLGLARDLRPGGYNLPLLLDDVLVHLDPDRAEGLAAVLVAEAAARQVIVFTCRPETVALLRRHAPDAHTLALPRWGGAARPLTLAGDSRRSSVRVETRADDEPRGRSTRAEADAHAEALLAAIRDNPDGRGKADLIEASGIPAAAWQTAIQTLLERGEVVHEGEKRGRIYKPA